MTLTEAWSAYLSVLRELAPETAASIRPARPPQDRQDAERATTPWTDELREFYSLHDGQDPGATGSLLPNLALLALDELVTTHRQCRESLHETEDIDPDWPATAREQQAGEIAHMFLDAYVPFAADSAGDFKIVDTRAGEHNGCIREFGWEGADEVGPLYPSLTEYIDSVRRSIESGTEHSYLLPRFDEGALFWEVD